MVNFWILVSKGLGALFNLIGSVFYQAGSLFSGLDRWLWSRKVRNLPEKKELRRLLANPPSDGKPVIIPLKVRKGATTTNPRNKRVLLVGDYYTSASDEFDFKWDDK